MSLSAEPVFSVLKRDFVCGIYNIANKRYAGVSGNHSPGGKAVDTTNGAGPHNLQMFILSADGTVLHCLPGYWSSEDLAYELAFAAKLNAIWQKDELSTVEKQRLFKEMHLAHIKEHSAEMVGRSEMQGFDQDYEVKQRAPNTDVIANPHLINPRTREIHPGAIKTTDVIMHERMASRPFLPYKKFDVAVFSDYGLPNYDKQEDFLDDQGNIAEGTDTSDAPVLGNDPRAHPIHELTKKGVKTGLNAFLNYGLPALVSP